jgi:trk system potassium uptake protein TrkH
MAASGPLPPPVDLVQAMLRLPLFLLVFGCASVSMLVPSIYGGIARDLETARGFFYAGVLGTIIFVLIAVAHAGRLPRHGALGPLMSVFSTFVFLPVFLAVPFHHGVQTTSFFNAYFEMVSAITTTGATLFDDPDRLDRTLHLWRAQVGWMGGLLMWIAASAILAPLNLGGFEVTAQAEPGRRDVQLLRTDRADPRARLRRICKVLGPLYLGLTLVLWLLLLVTGQSGFVALCHAMSVMATSGISPVGGLDHAGGSVVAEGAMLLFMVFALSRLTFSSDTVTATQQGGLRADPELRAAGVIIVFVPLVLFARHWVATLEVSAPMTVLESLGALWGAFFTVTSFLTTTGFASSHWAEAQSWSGLATPGLVLMGLAMIGGGVATTAGGVKLLRVFALYTNGRRELERLVHPSSVSGASTSAKRLQRNGAFIAWVFFMLFALSMAGITVVLTLLGVGFDDAIVLSIAGLSTTGPLVDFAADTPIKLALIGDAAKAVLCFAMVLGRLETLAIIALFTADLWRS